MTFDGVVLAAVAGELNSKLSGGRVVSIYQPEPLDIVLTIRNDGANYDTLMSADARSPRIHLTSTRRPNPRTPPNFCMLLRKHLDGARLIHLEHVDFDRILHLKFVAFDGNRTTLVVEIMGKHSNVILVSDSDRILGTVKPIGRRKSRYREILPGRQYIPPPSQEKINPLEVTEEEFDRVFADTFPTSEDVRDAELNAWLVNTFTGISPFTAREIAALSADHPRGLGGAFMDFMSPVRSGEFRPVLITDDGGRSIGFYAFPSRQHPASNQHERQSISSVADMHYTSALPRQAFEQAKDGFVGRVRKELDACERAAESARQSTSECETAERLKQIGELILSQMASIPEGAGSAELVDYYDPEGAKIEVEFDPQLSASENAEAYFTKYRKAVSGAEALRDRLAEINAKTKLLHKVLDSADSIESEEQIEKLLDVLDSQGIHVRKQEEAEVEKRKEEFKGHKIGRVVSDGWEILVGENSEANDYLLTRVAGPTDLWLHVKAVPSAHVVIRTNGKPDAVPKSVLYAAAELAARRSSARHSSLVPVDYTLRKYVRKPKGSAPGKVLYQNEKTLFVSPSP